MSSSRFRNPVRTHHREERCLTDAAGNWLPEVGTPAKHEADRFRHLDLANLDIWDVSKDQLRLVSLPCALARAREEGVPVFQCPTHPRGGGKGNQVIQ
jgi:hypothetical protein